MDAFLSEDQTPHTHERAQSGFTAARIQTCASRDGLVAIKDTALDLVIWQRFLPALLCDWIEQLDESTLPNLRILVSPNDLRAALDHEMSHCGMVASTMRDAFVEDVRQLVDVFATLTNSHLVDVRLERIDHDACWKFHRDHVAARLVTTYRGSTTEWVQMEFAEDAITRQRHYDGPLERLGPNDVALFKGTQNNDSRGVVHRSPAIEGTDETRLLLCLNRQTIVSPEPWIKP